MAQKIVKKFQEENERSARRAIIEDLFYDFHRSRRQVYLMNFVRGIFFGFGTLLGGTVVVALLIWVLSFFGDWFPAVGDVADRITETMEQRAQ